MLNKIRNNKKEEVKEEDKITLEEKNRRIQEEMYKMKRTTAIKLNSDNMINLVVEQLEKSGKMKTNETTNNKRKTGAKVLLDNFMTKEMNYEKEDWNRVEIEEINTGYKKDKNGKNYEMIYVTFKEEEEIKKFKNQLKYVKTETNERISQYISGKTLRRFQFYDNAAYSARRRGLKTKIVIGKFDFLLLTKNKADTQPWYNIPPRIVPDLPDFEVGNIREEEKEEEEKQKNERLEKIKKQNEEINIYEQIKEEKRIKEEDEMRKQLEEIAMSDDTDLDENNDEEEKNVSKKMKMIFNH